VLGVRAVDDPTRFGIAETRDGVVVALEEKPAEPKSNLALIGLYFFKEIATLKKALADLVASGKTTKGEIQLTDALAMMISEGVEFHTFESGGWYDCGKKETLLETNRILIEKNGSTPAGDGNVYIPPVYVEPTAKITNCILGPNVSVSAGAVLERSIISNTIVAAKAHIVDVILDDSLVGNESRLRGPKRSINIGDSSEFDLSR
jgi:glucose-1-phosphate thymidylyltransferase